jgi:hypothetical protein
MDIVSTLDALPIVTVNLELEEACFGWALFVEVSLRITFNGY